MVGFIWLYQTRELSVVPGKLSAVHDDATNGRTVPPDKLCGRVNDDVRTKVQWGGTGKDVANVLSIISGIPWRCAMSASVSMSAHVNHVDCLWFPRTTPSCCRGYSPPIAKRSRPVWTKGEVKCRPLRNVVLNKLNVPP